MPIQGRVSVQMVDKTTGNDLTTGVSGRIRFGTGGWAARTLTHTENGDWYTDLTGGEQGNASCDVKGTHATGITDKRSFANIPSPTEVWTETGTRQLTGTQSFNNTGQLANLPADLQEWVGAAPGATPAAALVAIHLDHLLAVVTTTFPGVGGSILGEMLERISTWRFIAEVLSQAPTGGGLSPTDTSELRHRLGMTGTKVDPGAVNGSLWSSEASGLIEDSAGDRFTAKALETAPSGGGSSGSESGGDEYRGEFFFELGVVAIDPGLGFMRFNQSNPSSTTAIYLNMISRRSTNISSFLRNLEGGEEIIVSRDNDGAQYTRFVLSGPIVDEGVWARLPVTFVSNVGGLFSALAEVTISFLPGTLRVSDRSQLRHRLQMDGVRVAPTFVGSSNLPVNTDRIGGVKTEEISFGYLSIPVGGAIPIPPTVPGAFSVILVLQSATGAVIAPDATPVIDVNNSLGDDRNGNLSVLTEESTGIYSAKYTVTPTHLEESLVFVATYAVQSLPYTTAYVQLQVLLQKVDVLKWNGTNVSLGPNSFPQVDLGPSQGHATVGQATLTPGAATPGQVTADGALTRTDVAGVDTKVSDLQVRTVASLTPGGRLPSSIEAVKDGVPAADRFSRGLLGEVLVTVGVGSTLTNIVTASLVPSAVRMNQFKDKVLTFDMNTISPELRGQTAEVEGNTVTGELTVSGLTDPPVNGDTATLG